MLSPAKQGSSFSYGMRVCPMGEGEDVHSMRSDSSRAEYEIWRRWEDCLWFQDTLELEYATLSREKRHRLQAGKGIKKNGIYIHDAAASFESLPPGPDPNSIAKDIHEHIPKLTKKGTLFRTSQATVEQRNKEFTALIDALFSEDMPTLIKDLRESREVRDFFGYWRRDRDLARKAKDAVGKSPRTSVATSGLSMYFSASTLSLQFPPLVSVDVPASPPAPRSVAKSASVPTAGPSAARGRSILQKPDASSSRHGSAAVSFSLSNKSSSSEDFSSGSSSHGSHPSRSQRNSEFDIQEVPVTFLGGSAPSSALLPDEPAKLHALPEEPEFHEALRTMTISNPSDVSVPARRRARTMSSHDRINRQCIVFASPPQSPASTSMSQISERPSMESTRSSVSPSMIELSESIMADNRFGDIDSSSSWRSSDAFSSPSSRRSSWRTSVSDMPPRPSSSQESYYTRASCVDLDLPFTRAPIMLHTPLDSSYRSRASVASMASILTESSADAIIPRTVLSPPTASAASLRRSLSVGSRRQAHFSYPSSVIEEGQRTWEDGEGDDLLESYLYGSSLSDSEQPPSPTFPEAASGPSTPGPSTPGGATPLPTTPGRTQINMNLSHPEYFPKPFQNRPPGQFHIPWSPKATEEDAGNPAESSFAVKAVHGDTIIAFRTSRMTSLVQIRKKLVEKFSSQEENPLANTFALGYLPPPGQRGKAAGGRPRSSSVSSVGVFDTSKLRYISSQESWDEAIATCGGKLTLRIID
ncbi:hypothetical protein GLOTRDRAFT_140408 [Gloeophyllum trabeum ATCC 11539]|uniref:PX domain-containing protein n=1 Tax=Gloeophyllum trabeum (strain ATCC 11539 / FP-39264 / Madison 617) TaxID=670483 RepID=S7PZ67_GLOTA|nr:uncharacterized protein GLOTRDRAFT_140408 [Gloeophyllum trabeum ATCC 11539]EPQ52783.1 hypothetical protein GLOTRDRAFT_140408 [Gloeophyllum trabeum ATCC 11539]